MTKLEIIRKENEDGLITNPALRSQYIDRVEVLDRVNTLVLLPNSTIATTQMVAEFYNVDQQAIYSVLYDHKSEIQSDGYRTVKSSDLINRIDSPSSKEGVSVKRIKGGYLVNDTHKISYSKIGIFTKRAILRIGMLLRDSLVAREVRTCLLNGFEKQVMISRVDEEDKLLLDIIKADGHMEIALSVGAYKKYKDNQIETLQEITETQNERYNLVMEKLGEIVALTQLNQLPHKA